MARRSTPAPRPPSLGDVARLAGVSTQTVSRVSTGAPHVRPATRERVERAMADLGYAPNAAARALRSGRFRSLGVIAHRLARTGESRMFEAIVEEARAVGYTVSVVDVPAPDAHEVEAAAERLGQQLIDGLIVIRHERDTPLRLSLPGSMPYVVSDAAPHRGEGTYGVAQYAGTRHAIEYLLGLGHRTVHHVCGPENSTPAAARQDGWRAALRAAGARVPAVEPGDWTPASGAAAAASLLRRRAEGEEITAVFAANDEMAAGVLHALDESGLRVPEDLSLLGFDNIPLAAYLTPALTTIQQDFHSVAHRLVTSLVHRIEAGEVAGGEATVAPAVVVPADLVVRDSTAPPGGGRSDRAGHAGPVSRA